jgi:hypothetical protein
VDSDFIQVKYHKDQANDKDYSHEGFGYVDRTPPPPPELVLKGVPY